MRDVMLITHFLGLAMGIGTSIGMMILGIAASKMPDGDRQKFQLNAFALSKMGHIGLAFLLISGGYLMTPYWGALMDMPLLLTKLILFLVLAALIGVISGKARRAKDGDIDEALAKIKPLGQLTLLISLIIVILAVSVFH